MSSAECYEMAQKYKSLKSELSSLHSSVDACVSSISNNESTMENTVLSGKPFDEGRLSESKGEISSINGNLSSMEDECTKKYTVWMGRYYAALKREKLLEVSNKLRS